MTRIYSTEIMRVSVVLVVLLFAISASALATENAERLGLVETLLENSSAARKVEHSGNAEAQSRREQAREHLQNARKAQAAGRTEDMDSELRAATGAMYEAVRLSGIDASITTKAIRDFDARLESINALCLAYDRIRREKGLSGEDTSELYTHVRGSLEQAEQLKAQGQVLQGRALLDEIYVLAKTEIEQLRGGDTLVRSLAFADKAEEYRYEIDRNDTHRMLVGMLLQEKVKDNAQVRAMVDRFLASANELRAQAESQAGQGSYEAAVESLEKSTTEILRAIRSAGVYIPG